MKKFLGYIGLGLLAFIISGVIETGYFHMELSSIIDSVMHLANIIVIFIGASLFDQAWKSYKNK